jgi:hypothetical protein
MPEARMDFLARGVAEGELAHRILTQGRMDPNQMRPWIHKDGRTYVTVYKGGDPSKITSYQAVPTNYTGTLRRDDFQAASRRCPGSC